MAEVLVGAALSVLCEYEPRTERSEGRLSQAGSRLILAEHREHRSYGNKRAGEQT
jgi:hypothetical protein